jgi:transposase
MQKHWDRPTLFLRQPGAPRDNDIYERALKRANLHRKNDYFCKTANGVRQGDAMAAGLPLRPGGK